MKKIFIFPLFLSLLFTACGNEPAGDPNRKYSDYKEFHLSTLDDFFSANNEKYFIEIYRNDCKYCAYTETNIFDYIDKTKENGELPKLFLFNLQEGNESANRNKFKPLPETYNRDVLLRQMRLDKPTSLNEIYFFGTPSLYVIENSALVDIYVGATEVNGFIKSVS